MYNSSLTEKPAAGIISFFGYQVNENIMPRDSIFNCFYGLTVIATLLIVPALAGATKNRKDALHDHLTFIILMITALSTCFVTFIQYEVTRDDYFDVGDMFHYYLGPKYLKELGYEDFYHCAAVAQHETGEELPRLVRELSTNRVFATSAYATEENIEAAKAKFTDERWEEFKADVQTFRGWHGSEGWQRRFVDHGYNGTPGWNVLASLITHTVPLGRLNLTAVSILNILTLLAMFVVVIKVFGWRFGLLFTILFCINFPDRFLLGGALLRYVWIASLVIGLSCLKAERYALAGALLAVSTMLIIFPLFFILGIVLKAGHALITEKKIPKKYLRFLVSAAAVGLAIGVFSLAVGQGFDNWTGFHSQMELNSGRLATGRVGFIYNFIWPKDVSKEVGQKNYEAREMAFEKPRLLSMSWKTLSTAIVALLLLLIVRLTGRLDDLTLTTFLGFAMFFLMFSTVRYYYAGLVGLPLMWHSRLSERSGMSFLVLLFLIQILAYASSMKLIYSFAYNTVLSAGFTLYIVGAIIFFFMEKRKVVES